MASKAAKKAMMHSRNHWFVVRTNPRCEDRAVASLAESGFMTYKPGGRKEIIHHRTKKVIERRFPLMVGYIFLAMPSRDRHWHYVRSCDGVKAVLGVNGTPIEVPCSDVDTIYDSEFRGEFDMSKPLKHYGHGYRAGQRVKVLAGPFTGFAADITNARGRQTLKIMVEIFGRMTPADIPVENVELAA